MSLQQESGGKRHDRLVLLAKIALFFVLGFVAGLVLVLAIVGIAHADDGSTPGYVKPPYVCGPTQAPSQVPCDQPGAPTTPPTTVELFKYCLGYPQQFPTDQPCPKPPDDICTVHPEEFTCHDPARTPAVARQPGGTVPPTTQAPEAATTSTEPAQVSPAVAIVHTQHRATQRVSRAPASTLPTTGSSDTTPLTILGLVLVPVGVLLLVLTRRPRVASQP